MNERLKALIESFCESLPAQVDALEAADAAGLYAAAHRLRGTSRSLGFETLDALLAAIETRARALTETEGAQDGLGSDLACLRAASAAVRPCESRLWSLAAG